MVGAAIPFWENSIAFHRILVSSCDTNKKIHQEAITGVFPKTYIYAQCEIGSSTADLVEVQWETQVPMCVGFPSPP